MLALSFIVELEAAKVDGQHVVGSVEGAFVLGKGGKQSRVPYYCVFLRPHCATVVEVLHE